MPVVNELPAKHESLTLLWENPSPSSSISNSFLTALADISQFDRFRVVWQMSVTVNGDEVQCDYLPLNQGKIDGTEWSWSMSAVIRADGQNTWARRISTDGSTRFWIGDCMKINAGGTQNNFLIPLRIYGVK